MYQRNLAAWVTLLAVLAISPLRAAEGETLVLTRGGQAASMIVQPDKPDQWERLAADELALHLEKISGAKVAMTSLSELDRMALPADTVRILIGRAATAKVADLNVERALDHRNDFLSCRDGFVLRAAGNVIALAGLPQLEERQYLSRGTLYAAYELLERLGCRWFWPGELGQVIPKRKTITIEPFETVQAPSFDLRLIRFTPDPGPRPKEVNAWYRRSRTNSGYSWALSHNDRVIKLARDPSDPVAAEKIVDELLLPYFKKHPQATMFGVGWKDGYERVTSDQAMGTLHPWAPVPQASDVLIQLYNGIARRARAALPDRQYTIGFLAYMNFITPPVGVLPHPDLVPTVTPIEQCPRHVPFSGSCWQRDTLMRITEQWGKRLKHMGWYDYEPGFLVDGGVPIPATARLRKEIPLIYQYGVRAMYTQVQASAANCGPNFYLRTRLLWNVDADVDAMLDDYFAKLYGRPAGKSVQAYWNALERMMAAPKGGHQHEDEIIKYIYPIEKIRTLDRHIIRAERLTENSDDSTRNRVRGMRFAHDNLMTYLRMRQAEDESRFADAAGLTRQMLTMRKAIRDVDVYLYKFGDLDRNSEDADHLANGWLRQNEGRAACIDGTQGQLVATLPDVWRFKIDPHGEGIVDQWFEPDHNHAGWRTMRTTRIWEVQGLEDSMGRGYNGVGWYRTKVRVPEKFAGQPINLNFGGVFGKLQVYVNGQFAGYRPFRIPWWKNGYNQSFDIDVTDAIKPGETNTIVVRVDNDHDWGGIYRRVFLWSPREE